MSVGNVFIELDLCEFSTTLIVGKNGASKSTVVEALYFALYGKPFRKITKGQLVNSINKKDLLVELEFDTNGKEYLIRRGIKPNIFEIFCNEKLVDQTAAVKDYQEILENEILKLDSKSFRKVVVLAKTDYVPYMQLPAAARREFIEDLLDLKIFSVMNVLLKEKIQKNKGAINDATMNMEFSNKLIENIEKNIRDRKEDNSELLQSYNDKISENKEAGQVLLKELEFVTQDITLETVKLIRKPDVESKINECRKLKNSIENKINSQSEKMLFYAKHDDCSECGQHIDETFKDNFIETSTTAIASHQVDVITINSQLEKLNEKIVEFNEIEEKKKKLESNATELKYKLKSLQDSTKSLLAFIAKLEKQQEEISQDELNSEKEKIKNFEKIYQNLHTDKENFSILALLLKDGGLKSKIIKKYIPIINQLVSKYLEMLELFVLFELNEDFEETVKSRFRDDFSYASFSEGEKLRIDASLIFAFRSIARMRNNNDCNLMIMDETFDASLDKDGVQQLMNLINEDQKDNNVFVISHNTDDMTDSFERTLTFVKDGNFSRIEEIA